MQSVQLQVSGLYTAPSDYAGLPPGALNRARNVESRHRNILESRRGFDGLPGTAETGVYRKRLTNFPVLGVDSLVALSSAGDLVYYDAAADAWVVLDGYSGGLVAPDALANSRFIRGGQNLYVTDQSGVLSLASGSGSDVKRAGVPKGLDLTASVDNSVSGFFTNNVALTTTGFTSSGAPYVAGLQSVAGVEAGQYVGAAGVPVGTTVLTVQPAQVVLTETGGITVLSTSVTGLASITGLFVGMTVSGAGIPEGTKLTAVSGAGPYGATLSQASTATIASTSITFLFPAYVTLSANATATAGPVAVSFYTGAQVGYRMLFGRVETDVSGNTTTRYGAPSSIAVATNTLGTTTNVNVTGTLPKNSSDQITFVQLYRSAQTASAAITPLDEMKLVYERDLVAGDFTARQVTINDIAPDSVRGLPLYTGADREGILQANNPPPACWDMAIFRDFALYANCTEPSTLDITLDAVGAPSGLQIGDVITITSGAHVGTYTAAAAENTTLKQFKVYSAGTPSQNITDTANSLIKVINFDESVPVHAILTSSTVSLPGKMTLESDLPYGTFTATMSAHTSSFDPALSNLTSETNSTSNGVYVSKSGEIESVPGTNTLPVGDSSSPCIRILALRDYALVIKGDGLYKIIGTDPKNLIVQPFDLTTRIIGPDTAVQLNSGVWMLSNQGVVSIDDSGVNAKSPPIDDQINTLLGSVLTGLNSVAFGVGYESDRKYILSVPETDADSFTSTQYVYNYVTNSWTTWDRNLYCGFVHSNEGKLYIGRADVVENGVSMERKSGTFRDYADEAISGSIISITSSTVVVVADAGGAEVGDILFQSESASSPIIAVDLSTNTITTQYAANWSVAVVDVLKSIECEVQFKQVFADNPAFVRQFPEGIVLFKKAAFNEAVLSFSTDFSQGEESTDLASSLLTGWGLATWNGGTWGGTSAPTPIRFYIPANKQLGSYIIPTLTIAQAWSDWRFQGMSISWSAVSQEVGK